MSKPSLPPSSLRLPGAASKLQPTAMRAVLRVESSELLGERGELVIEHEGREYRLRRTQSGKLILTA